MNDADPPAPRPPETAKFVDRALGKLSAAWRSIAGEAVPPEAAARKRWRERMQECLEAAGGEVAARARTAALGHEYLGLPDAGREAFLRVLAEEFDPPLQPIIGAADAVRAAPDSAARRKAAARLAASIE